MKAFVINLDSRPDRMERFKENQFPFEVERFPGVVASCGEDGCTYSHLKILSEQKEFPFVVFEDDFVLLQPWSLIEQAMTQLPPDWDGLWISSNLRRPIQKYSKNLYRLIGGYASHGIIYGSKKMVDYILTYHNTPSGKNLDIFYCHRLQKIFNCYVVSPLAGTQLSDYSDIAQVHTDNYNDIIKNWKRFM